MNDLHKLQHLLPHWIEHNDSHLETFREWASRAEAAGAGPVAAALREAIRSVEAANDALRGASQRLGGSPEGHG